MSFTLNQIRVDAISLGYKGNTSHLNKLAKLINDDPKRVYDLMQEFGIPLDSVIREKLFRYISDKYHNGDYRKIYDRWLA